MLCVRSSFFVVASFDSLPHSSVTFCTQEVVGSPPHLIRLVCSGEYLDMPTMTYEEMMPYIDECVTVVQRHGPAAAPAPADVSTSAPPPIAATATASVPAPVRATAPTPAPARAPARVAAASTAASARAPAPAPAPPVGLGRFLPRS